MAHVWHHETDQQYAALAAQREQAIRAAQAAAANPSSLSGAGIAQSNIGRIERQMQAVVARREAQAREIQRAQAAPAVTRSSFDYGAWRAQQDQADAAAAETRRVNTALAEARAFFETYGMMGLWNGVEALVRQGYNSADTISGILSRDPNYQAAYFERFPAVQVIRDINRERQQNGQPIMAEPSPATYVALEEGYRTALVGLPQGIWGSVEDVTTWIVNDVSPKEVSDRVTTAKNYIYYSANEAVKSELRGIYGMTDAEMTAYVLDADRALEFIENEYQTRMRQATVGGAASTAGVNVSDSLRDSIAGSDLYGQSFGNALSGFQQVAEISDTYEDLGRMSRMDTSTDELVSDQFGMQGAADISNKKRRLASQERARFSGSSAITQYSMSPRAIGSQ